MGELRRTWVVNCRQIILSVSIDCSECLFTKLSFVQFQIHRRRSPVVRVPAQTQVNMGGDRSRKYANIQVEQRGPTWIVFRHLKSLLGMHFAFAPFGLLVGKRVSGPHQEEEKNSGEETITIGRGGKTRERGENETSFFAAACPPLFSAQFSRLGRTCTLTATPG